MAQVHGTEMQTFNEADWQRVLKHKQIVFARTMYSHSVVPLCPSQRLGRPQQKQDIVRELNKLGNVVAMTGDGNWRWRDGCSVATTTITFLIFLLTGSFRSERCAGSEGRQRWHSGVPRGLATNLMFGI